MVRRLGRTWDDTVGQGLYGNHIAPYKSKWYAGGTEVNPRGKFTYKTSQLLYFAIVAPLNTRNSHSCDIFSTRMISGWMSALYRGGCSLGIIDMFQWQFLQRSPQTLHP
jgi:hypothetical protein